MGRSYGMRFAVMVGVESVVPRSAGATETGVFELDPREGADSTTIVLHGLGADVSEFVAAALHLRIRLPRGMRFIFPRAPLRPVTIAGGRHLRAWYDVRCYDRAKMDIEGIRRSEEAIRAHIRDEVTRGVPPHRIVLAGFSQGGAMALHVGLRHPTPLAGIVALAAGIPLPDQIPLGNGNSPPVLMGHGVFDRVVRFRLGAASSEFLAASGYHVEWHRYLIGHSVCPRELDHVARWLARVLAPPEERVLSMPDSHHSGERALAPTACTSGEL
jgi:phospholipase/carboxylesterase